MNRTIKLLHDFIQRSALAELKAAQHFIRLECCKTTNSKHQTTNKSQMPIFNRSTWWLSTGDQNDQWQGVYYFGISVIGICL
jgi:hypothetical protein